MMSPVREKRLRAIAELIRGNQLASQEEVAERLSALGFAVTQATVSRDLEQLGALKVRGNGRISYALPDQVAAAPPSPDRLSRVISEWVRSIVPAGNMLVLKTPPGSAHLIGVELDRADLPEVVGTICGDDTVFVACPSPDDAAALAGRLRTAAP